MVIQADNASSKIYEIRYSARLICDGVADMEVRVIPLILEYLSVHIVSE
jgi:hypothetical protein